MRLLRLQIAEMLYRLVIQSPIITAIISISMPWGMSKLRDVTRRVIPGTKRLIAPGSFSQGFPLFQDALSKERTACAEKQGEAIRRDHNRVAAP